MQQEQQKSLINTIIKVFAVAVALYHLAYAAFVFQTTMLHYHTHASVCCLLVILIAYQGSKTKLAKIFNLSACIFIVIQMIYVQITFQDLLMRALLNRPYELVMGFLFLVLMLLATHREYGILMPLIAIVLIIYPFIGTRLPEPLFCAAYSVPQTISRLTLCFDQGLYQTPLQVSANCIFLFILFGSLLEVTGCTRIFTLVSRIISPRLRGGPGIMAVIVNTGIGMVTGSVAAAIAISGSLTLPEMKKGGYTPEQAAGIIAAASNGSQVMPPVMGLVAFLMAGLVGCTYFTIIKMSVIPALLYYLCIALYVQFSAGKMGLKPTYRPGEEKIPKKEILHAMFLFLVPFTTIVVLLATGYSVMKVSFWAVILAIAVSLIRKETRPSLNQLIEGFVNGSINGAAVALICGTVGCILTMLNQTGFGVKLSSGIVHWSGGNMHIALLIIYCIAILMGMGGIGPSSYIIIAVFGVPALVKIGIPLVIAHYFVMFPCIFAFLTPPVAFGAMISSKMAKAKYMGTAIEASKAGFAAFIMPFLFIYVPALLLQPYAMPEFAVDPITGVIAVILIIVNFQAFGSGFFVADCKWVERGLGLVATIVFFVYLLARSRAFFIAGLFCFAIFLGMQIIKKNRLSAQTNHS